jgi:hypothetical protein
MGDGIEVMGVPVSGRGHSWRSVSVLGVGWATDVVLVACWFALYFFRACSQLPIAMGLAGQAELSRVLFCWVGYASRGRNKSSEGTT